MTTPDTSTLPVRPPGRGEAAHHIDQVDRLRPVPADLARYEIDLPAAAAVLRVEPDWLAARAAGRVDHLDHPDRGPLYEYNDLHNVALLSGTGSTVPELARRFLMRFADAPPPSWYQPRTWLVTVRASRSDEPQEGRSAAVGFAVPDGAARGVELLDPALVAAPAEPPPTADQGYQDRPYQVLVRLTGAEEPVRDRRVRAAYDEIVDALVEERVVYQAVAETLRASHHRAWSLGMADCVVVSKLLADRLADLGLPARARRGYMLGLLGSDHTWCEVLEDGRWKVLDPVFAYLAAGTATAAAFREACCGSRFNRLLPCAVSAAAPLVIGPDGRPLPPWGLSGVSAQMWGEIPNGIVKPGR